MRKRLINICAILILAFSIYGCGQTAEVTSAIVTETVEPQDTEAESEEVSNEVEPDNTVAEEEQEQDEDETDLMSNITAEDMFFYKINDNGAVVTGLREKYKNYLQENMPIDNEIEIPDTLFG